MTGQGDHSGALQLLVFFVVSAAFTTIYVVQPVLPLLQTEFGVDEKQASYAVSAVILGIALANLPFGSLIDRYPVKPIIGFGGIAVTAIGLMCAVTRYFPLLVGLRFLQGAFIPALTTCIAAHLSRTQPRERLNVFMGAYVSATVIGGLGGRLLGGWIQPPLTWRHAFAIASILVLVATLASLLWLPGEGESSRRDTPDAGYLALLSRPHLLRIYATSFGAFFVFSSVYNYLPFYLSGERFGASTEMITAMYLAYIFGVIVAPVSGKISNRLGNGITMILGAAVFGIALACTHIPHLMAVAASLAGVCIGFFAIHAAAAGSMNRRLDSSRGRANSLYILFYYLGGSIGITVSGFGYQYLGWAGVTGLGAVWLTAIAVFGIVEQKHAA